MIALLQGQVNAMQQYCMALQQQPHLTIYSQQQRAPSNHPCGLSCRNGSGKGRYQQLGYQQPAASAPMMYAPTPFKCFENWHYCSTHGGNIDDTHTRATCAKPGPLHNWQATHANMMGGSMAGMHKTILLSASGRAPPVARVPQMQCPPTPMAWQPSHHPSTSRRQW
jgi:hypothetical protein